MELIVDIKKKLKDYTLNINFNCDNDILGILGESGSGKSMTLKCIAGLVTPDAGRIVLNGRILFDSKKHINIPVKDRKVGMLFQNYALFPHMTVEKNIGYGLSNLPGPAKEKVITELLEMMQLEDARKSYPGELSGGQQQRVALARTLAVKPEALLLDEPFSALDNHLRTMMLHQISEVLSNYKGTTLFVTHNLEEAYHLCDNLLILSDGNDVGSGSKKALFKNPPTVQAAKLTGCQNISKAKVTREGLIEALDWKCIIPVQNNSRTNIKYIGIRAHDIKLAPTEESNALCCWPVFEAETPFTKLVYLKINSAPKNKEDYHLIWEIPNEYWNEIDFSSLPLKILVPESNLIIM